MTSRLRKYSIKGLPVHSMNGRVCDNVSTEVVRRQVNEEVKDIIVSSNIYSQQSFNAAKTAMSYQILRFGLKMVHETLERSEITATTKTVQIRDRFKVAFTFFVVQVKNYSLTHDHVR